MDIKVEMFFTTLENDKVFFLKKTSKLPKYQHNPTFYVGEIVSKLENSGFFVRREREQLTILLLGGSRITLLY